MTTPEAKRRLIWHGLFVFGLSLLVGAVVPVLTNPRMGVSAHVGAAMSGMLLVLIGLIWDQIVLPAWGEAAAFWLFLYATYTGWLAQFLAGLWGTSRATPIGGAGYAGEPWQELTVYVVAVSFSLAIAAAWILTLCGLRRARSME
jgi:hydroxylaminobenzene mutase